MSSMRMIVGPCINVCVRVCVVPEVACLHDHSVRRHQAHIAVAAALQRLQCNVLADLHVALVELNLRKAGCGRAGLHIKTVACGGLESKLAEVCAGMCEAGRVDGLAVDVGARALLEQHEAAVVLQVHVAHNAEYLIRHTMHLVRLTAQTRELRVTSDLTGSDHHTLGTGLRLRDHDVDLVGPVAVWVGDGALCDEEHVLAVGDEGVVDVDGGVVGGVLRRHGEHVDEAGRAVVVVVEVVPAEDVAGRAGRSEDDGHCEAVLVERGAGHGGSHGLRGDGGGEQGQDEGDEDEESSSVRGTHGDDGSDGEV